MNSYENVRGASLLSKALIALLAGVGMLKLGGFIRKYTSIQVMGDQDNNIRI